MHILTRREKIEKKTPGDKRFQQILRRQGKIVVYIHVYKKYIVSYITKHPQRDVEIDLLHSPP